MTWPLGLTLAGVFALPLALMLALTPFVSSRHD